jgi:prephenate dehydrogenase
MQVSYENLQQHCTDSQLAHIVSSAYIKSPTAQKQAGFSAGSFKDMTRVAFLNERMWTELFLRNREHLGAELAFLMERLREFETALRMEDETTLCRLLREGRECKILSEGRQTP